MTRIVRHALLPALLSFVAHAQIGNRCNLTSDMDYLMVATNTINGESPTTHIAGPDWFRGGGEIARRIADHASLQDGKEWLGLPDQTPAYCELTIDVEVSYEFFDDSALRWEVHVYSLPKDRWTHERNRGVAGFLRALDEWFEEDTVTVSVMVDQAAHSWLADYYARLESELEALEGSWAEEPGEGVPDPVADGGEDHFLAVATSPAAGTRILPGESGYYGIGWHTESQRDAGLAATAECRRQGGGGACFSNASGKSLRGGCVGLAIGKWRDRDDDPERAYVVTSSSFRDLIVRDLRSGCESTAFSGKYEYTVVEHSCEIVNIMCAANIAPASDPPAQ